MTLECKIKAIEWKWIANIDCNKWEANKNGKYPIEILMMRNGIGKTSTLELLQHLFAGIKLEKINTPVQSDRARYKGLSSYKNGELKKSEIGQRELAVTIEINQENWMLMYKFNNDESAEIHTRSPDGVYSTEYNMPSVFTNVFKNNLPLCQSIFIDATDEGRKKTLMAKDTLNDMIQRLSNIKILNLVREERIPRLLEKIRQDANKSGTEKQKETSEQQLKVVNKKIADLTKTLEDDNKVLETKMADLSATQLIIKGLKEKSKNAKEYATKEKVLSDAERDRKNASKELLEALFVPGNLPIKLISPIKEYYSNLGKERIPKSIATEMFTAIVERRVCICGEEITPGGKMETCILDERKRSMGSPILADVYRLKDVIRSAEELNNLDTLKKRIKTLNKRVDEIRTELDYLGGKETADILQQMQDAAALEKELEGEIRVIKKRREMINEKNMSIIRQNKKEWVGRSMKSDETPAVARGSIKDDCNNLYWAKRIKKVIEDNLSSIAGVANTQNAANCLSDLFEHVEQEVTKSLQETLLEQTKINLKKFELLGNLDVKDFTNGITLEFEYFTEMKESNSGSTGENLAILMGFSESLGSIMDVTIPLIIDNPIKGSDYSKVAGTCQAIREITKDRDIILFIYDLERDPLHKNLEVNYNYSTLYREHEWYENPIPFEEAKKLGKIGRTKISYDKNMYFKYSSAVEK